MLIELPQMRQTIYSFAFSKNDDESVLEPKIIIKIATDATRSQLPQTPRLATIKPAFSPLKIEEQFTYLVVFIGYLLFAHEYVKFKLKAPT